MLKIDYKKVFISMSFLIDKLNQKRELHLRKYAIALRAYKLMLKNYLEDNDHLQKLWFTVLKDNISQEEIDQLYIPNKQILNIINKF